ncbi:MAG: phosphoribosylamine--glycine ligase [Flavobacteriaceae bacterium]
MNILVIGSGGREHTFCWKLAQSEVCDHLFVAPGNAGTAAFATNLPVEVNDFEQLKKEVLTHQIEMVVVGPEDPLVQGIHDFFLADSDLQNVAIIGPQQEAAQLEGSKDFAKAFMMRHGIPTAKYATFTPETLEEGYAFLEEQTPPYVLKADGLAAGKGVLILAELEEAKKELKSMLIDEAFGEASKQVVVEEFLDGIELSCFVLTDGKGHVVLPMAKDYKRIGEGDQGLNTGGMGAVSPVTFVTPNFEQKIKDQIIIPTLEGLQKDGIPYQGFIFIGLIKVGDEPKVIEYNVRMGDPETQVVLPLLKNDLGVLFSAVANQTLADHKIEIDARAAVTVVAVSGGYPQAYTKGKVITGLSNESDSLLFHAGTRLDEKTVKTNGGRVLALTSFGTNHREAAKRSYEQLAKIDFEGMYYRKDIGNDL